MNERIQKKLRDRIETFATDVTVILQRAVADSVAEALAKETRIKSSRGKASAGPRGKPVDAALLLREVAREGGRRMEQIAESLGAETKDLTPVMKELLEAKKVKKRGLARGTTYRAG